MAPNKNKIKSIGEIALRVENLAEMKSFYRNLFGFEVIGEFEDAVFFKIADGYKGHTEILALFDRSKKENYKGIKPEHTTIDHIAFTIGREDYESEKERLVELGLDVRTAVHSWVKWKSIYITDPEGNEVELVCYDESIK